VHCEGAKVPQYKNGGDDFLARIVTRENTLKSAPSAGKVIATVFRLYWFGRWLVSVSVGVYKKLKT
jgi:hypothetical protein